MSSSFFSTTTDVVIHLLHAQLLRAPIRPRCRMSCTSERHGRDVHARGLCQTKNGFSSFLAVSSMKSHERASTGSRVILVLVPRRADLVLPVWLLAGSRRQRTFIHDLLFAALPSASCTWRLRFTSPRSARCRDRPNLVSARDLRGGAVIQSDAASRRGDRGSRRTRRSRATVRRSCRSRPDGSYRTGRLRNPEP